MGFSYTQLWKPVGDKAAALIALLLCLPFLLLFLLILLGIHRGNPLFFQQRIGQHGESFTIFKLRTLKANQTPSPFLKLLRKLKLDELPQLLNILLGEMSWVGPRPDLPGYYDQLSGNYKKILQLKPGLTGYASLQFFDEERLLQQQAHPKQYNDEVIFPKKVRLNYWYVQHISFSLDLKILVKTLLLPFQKS